MSYYGLLRALNIDMYVHYVAIIFQRFVKHLQLEFVKFMKIFIQKPAMWLEHYLTLTTINMLAH